MPITDALRRRGNSQIELSLPIPAHFGELADLTTSPGAPENLQHILEHAARFAHKAPVGFMSTSAYIKAWPLLGRDDYLYALKGKLAKPFRAFQHMRRNPRSQRLMTIQPVWVGTMTMRIAQFEGFLNGTAVPQIRKADAFIVRPNSLIAICPVSEPASPRREAIIVARSGLGGHDALAEADAIARDFHGILAFQS
jgi:hypothetical protein